MKLDLFQKICVQLHIVYMESQHIHIEIIFFFWRQFYLTSFNKFSFLQKIFCYVFTDEKGIGNINNKYQRGSVFYIRLLRYTMHTVSFDWFLSGLEWILNLEFCWLKLLIVYQKWLWNIRSRLNSSTFWVFEPVFRYVWSKLKLFAQKMKILNKYI